MKPVSRGIDRIEVTFDEPNLVANAGLLLGGDVGRSSRSRAPDQRHGPPLGTRRRCVCRDARCSPWCTPWWRAARTSTTPTCCARERPRSVLGHRVMAPSTLGHLPAGLHLRPRPSARRRARRGAAPGLGARGGPGVGAAGHRPRLDHLRGVRQGQGRCRLRLHQEARLSPAPRHLGRHRRGAPCPHAQGSGQHPARHGALRRRAGRPGAPGRSDRRARSCALTRAFGPTRTIATLERLDVGYTMGVRMIKVRGQRRRGHRRVGLDPDRVHRRRRGRGGRVQLQGPPPHRAPHPAGRAPGHAVARVAPLRLRDRSRRATPSTSTPSTAPMPASSSPSGT